MTTPSQNLNKSYGYLWWLNGQSSYMRPASQKVHRGHLIPNAPKDLVIIRMGEIADEDSLVPITFDNELWEKINALIN